mmetsp:Transcript_57743/g.187575  ORF Transcript_57743/g.187575 Transcript_57743/m.187575 type:complete len:515 (-) Transcript_57743:23-1567(-)
MLRHLVPSHHVGVAELRGRQKRCLARPVREGALARKDKVQPLREQTSMERHLAAVRLGHAPQLPPQGLVQGGRPVVEVRHVADNFQDGFRRGQGGTHGNLKLGQDILALVGTTDHVVWSRHDAIGGRLQVVRNDHLRAPPRRGLVQGTQHAKVTLGLTKAPLSAEVCPVEVRDADTASGSGIHVSEGSLDNLALGLPIRSEGLADASDELEHVLEAVAALQRQVPVARTGRALAVRFGGLDRAGEHRGDVPPMRDILFQQGHVGQQRASTVLVSIEQPVHGEGLQEACDLGLAEGLAQGQPEVEVDLLQEREVRAEDELLQGLRHDDRVLQREAVLGVQAVEQLPRQRGRVLAEDFGGAGVRGVQLESGLESFHQDLVAMHEMAVHHVAQQLPLDSAILVLGHRVPNWEQRLACRLSNAQTEELLLSRHRPPQRLGAAAAHRAQGRLQLLAAGAQDAKAVAPRAGAAEEALGIDSGEEGGSDEQTQDGRRRHGFAGGGGVACNAEARLLENNDR